MKYKIDTFLEISNGITIEDLVDRLVQLQTEGRERGYKNLVMEIFAEPDCYTQEIHIKGERPETAAEMKARIAMEMRVEANVRESKAAHEKRERSEYQRLKKKFEP